MGIHSMQKEKETGYQSPFNCNRRGTKGKKPRLTYRMVQKMKEGYKPHTVQCKDMKGNIIDDKEQIRGRWKEHFEETLNENTW